VDVASGLDVRMVLAPPLVEVAPALGHSTGKVEITGGLDSRMSGFMM